MCLSSVMFCYRGRSHTSRCPSIHVCCLHSVNTCCPPQDAHRARLRTCERGDASLPSGTPQPRSRDAYIAPPPQSTNEEGKGWSSLADSTGGAEGPATWQLVCPGHARRGSGAWEAMEDVIGVLLEHYGPFVMRQVRVPVLCACVCVCVCVCVTL